MKVNATIVGVLDRSSQGVTRPFMCCGDDGGSYWVKGASAGRRALCCEWVAGQLAQRLGLPVPTFAQVEVPEALVRASMRTDIHDLGVGLAFGSRDVRGVQEFNWSHTRWVSPDLQARVLLFDWWVCNLDRTLGERGGNPNILWDVENGRPWIIDHNLAFDPAFSIAALLESHVFAAARATILPETLARERDRMRCLLAELDQIWLEIPHDWLYLAGDLGTPTDFVCEDIRRILSRVETDFDRDWGCVS